MNDERVTTAGPSEVRDPETRREIRRAFIWLSMAGAFALVVLLIQPIMLILGGVIFAVTLDGGSRLIGRYVPILPRWLRLLLIMVVSMAFIFATFILAGVQIAQQAALLRDTIEVQADRFLQWLSMQGMMPQTEDFKSIMSQIFGSLGKVTGFIGSAFGSATNIFLIAVIGLFLAMEPRVYERGLQWMLPSDQRAAAKITIDRMGHTMRRLMAGRLLGMAFEGVLTWAALSICGVPMAMILGILTGLLAFIPNIGAFISGLLMVAVGFSAGVNTGLLAILVYFVVQTFDGYVLLPMVAKKTVDMPPAITIATQILFSSLFGLLGLALADPLVAMIKVGLERRAEENEVTAVPRPKTSQKSKATKAT